jgi:hypothetical protein
MSDEGGHVLAISLVDFRPVARFLTDVAAIARDLSDEPNRTTVTDAIRDRLEAAFRDLGHRLLSCRPCQNEEHVRCIDVDPDGLTCPCPHT